MYQSILTEVDNDIGILTLNRSDRHNALDKTLVAEMTAALLELEADPRVRIVVLSSTGKSFCAGTDPAWMREAINGTPEDNSQSNRNLARLLRTLSELSKPTIARVQGSAFGVGVGLIAACDIVFATYDASFALNEVKYGLLPAIASPYLIAAIGERHCRYFMLTAERFSGTEAYRIGLVHEMVPGEEQLDEAIGETIDTLLKNSPNAMSACKTLIRVIGGQPVDNTTIEETIQSTTVIQSSTEGREGMLALVEKRKPDWALGRTD